MDEKDLIGKTIEEIDLDGFGIKITFTDGTILTYWSSDGGYSLWDIVGGEKKAPTIGGWISVEDRLPEATKPDANGNITFSDYVLTYQTYEDGHRWIAEDTCRVDHGCWMHEVPGMGCRVTHWMPLPSTEGLDET